MTMKREPRYAVVLVGLAALWDMRGGPVQGYEDTYAASLRAMGRLARGLNFGRGGEEDRGREFLALLRQSMGVTHFSQITPQLLDGFGRKHFGQANFTAQIQRTFEETYREDVRRMGFNRV